VEFWILEIVADLLKAGGAAQLWPPMRAAESMSSQRPLSESRNRKLPDAQSKDAS